jgi:predicted PurR-regulated permease PerM
MIDPNVLNSDHVPSRSTMLDLALQIGLVGFLIYACSRYISPFSDLLIWSAILAVMLYPLQDQIPVFGLDWPYYLRYASGARNETHNF